MPPSELPRSTQVPGRRRPLGAFMIILVLCLISFALGIFIGKHNKGSQQQAIAPPPLTHPVVRNVATADVEQPAAGIVVGKDVVAPDMTAEHAVSVMPERDAGMGQFPSKNSVVAHEETVPAAVVNEQSPLGNGLNQPEAVVAPVAKDHSAVSVTAVAPASVATVGKTAAKVVSNASGYVIQVGSFKQQLDAQKVQQRLQAKFAVQVRRADLGSKGVWYRVLVGPVASSAEAEKVKDNLQQEFKLAGFVKKNTD